MGLERFKIILEQPVYYGGQTLAGKLFITTDAPLQMRAVVLNYFGECDVRWSRGTKNGRRYYTNNEKYLNLQQLIYGDYDEDCELPEGEHIYLFSCPLPMRLPSSFEGRHGRIRYSVKATIKRSWKFDDTTTEPFYVVEILDLNKAPLAASPVQEVNSKTFWCHSSPLSMSVEIPVRGFVSGQIIPVKVSVDNESDVQVGGVRATLRQITTFHARSTSRDDENVIFRNEFPLQNGRGREEIFLNLNLPALPHSNLQSCKIIDLKYVLSITAKVNAWYHRNLTMPINLIIGNVPLLSYQIPVQPIRFTRTQIEELPVSENCRSSDSLLPDYQFVAAPFSESYGEHCPVPTYEQCVPEKRKPNKKQGNDANNDGVEKPFIPLYPVYRFHDGQT
ncbi:arrestin domain-containing protein 2-like isoform X1 [Athalia rosae]|uniref:arrestin domain-containing protein 2-like isoform X1 n=1 Tax=Athalia rosae TaxID=37344 RepID=UPI0020348167|nr:arrestin domain-containing protein 2-like isoform X1 [Athalia rosae]